MFRRLYVLGEEGEEERVGGKRKEGKREKIVWRRKGKRGFGDKERTSMNVRKEKS